MRRSPKSRAMYVGEHIDLMQGVPMKRIFKREFSKVSNALQLARALNASGKSGS